MAKDTKEKLLSAAQQRFWQYSYATVSVDDICDDAGVRKGAFYHHFESKAELMLELLDWLWESHRENLDRAFSPSLPPVERLMNYSALVYSKQKECAEKSGKVLGCPYMNSGSELSTQEERFRAKTMEMSDRATRYFETLLRDAQALGQTRMVDAAAGAQEMQSYVNGLMYQAKIKNDLDIIRRGLLPGLMRYLQSEKAQMVREEELETA